MCTAVVRVANPTELSAFMTRMRVWMDEHKCEPSRFRYNNSRASLVIRVDFTKAAEAEAFKTRFGD